MATFIKRILYIGAAYISLIGLVTFSLFMFEEAIQMATFGTWPASDAKDWQLVMSGCQTIEAANHTMKIVNCSIGWIQPLAFLSYRAYARSTDYYLDAMKAKIFAHAPEMLAGHKITTTISLRKARVMDTDDEAEEGILYQLSAKKALYVRFKEVPTATDLRVTGMVEANDHGAFIHADLVMPVK